jgi:predicted outer membrane protein
MRRFTHVLAAALLLAATGCGQKSETKTTTTTTAPAGAPTAAAPASTAGAMSSGTMSSGTSTKVQAPEFATEVAAQGHCPSDTVVWLNTKSHVYHEKGMLYYGHTKAGAYVCRKEADAAGDHETKNAK